MKKMFLKGCEAIAEAAIRSGCRFYAGYPITPQNEIPEYFARRMPEVNGSFIQGESEIASINMVYGAAQTGVRAMTSSSSCGISLKSEGISFCAAARVPIVYCNVMRGGPGIGSIQPAQQDYLQATKASGNGGFRMLVFAPSTVQEAADMTFNAFDLAQRDRNPVLILIDGVIGAIMEPVELPDMRSDEEIAVLKAKTAKWALTGHKQSDKRLMLPGGWTGQEGRCKENAAMYEYWDQDIQVEHWLLDDAEIVIVAYGVSARVAKSAIRILRRSGHKIGLIRPKTLSPFPYASFERLDYSQVRAVLDVEMSIPAQMVYDVALGVKGRCKIATCLRSGGEVIGRDEIISSVKDL